MKNLTLVLLILFSSIAQAQIVDIPDLNFRYALIEQGFDKNGDKKMQESEVENIQYLNLTKKNISSLQGIKSFKNLSTLLLTTNQLSSLDLEGMKSLKTLYCNSNQIDSLNIKGLTNMEELVCGYNLLKNLDVKEMTNIKTLVCNSNQISNLDVKELTNLENLGCGNNLISTLEVKDLKNLVQLSCPFNLLTNLDLQELINLLSLDCGYNSLTELNLNGLSKLWMLRCGGTKIKSLDLKGLSNLTHAFCPSGEITHIDVTGVTTLQTLECQNNLLNTLDVSDLILLDKLDCSYNNLLSLFIKNGISYFQSFSGNPNLQYICCDDINIDKIKNQAISNGLSNCTVNSYCSFTPGGAFYTLKGENKFDIDNNGCDDNDPIFPNLNYSITNGVDTGLVLSNKNGKYSIPVQEGNYIFKPLLNKPKYYNLVPAFLKVSFPFAGDSVIQNFCITPSGIHHDVQINIIPLSPANPGFAAIYKIIYKNTGTQTENGTINFMYDDAILDFTGANIKLDAQIAGQLNWNFTDLKPFESRSSSIGFKVNSPIETPPVNVGDILNYEANITSANLDEVPLDNIFDLNQTVVGSFDPNDKTCLEGNTIKPSMVGEYVHYLIRFENTGTYAAENVVVKDVIDASVFDVQSLQITDASHKMFTRVNNNLVEFIFEDIQLPFDDANNDGYVAFEIKTRPSLALGDSLKNKAEIYFDYNLPIITNEAQTLVKNAVRTTEAKALAIDFYPNPAKDHVKFLINDHIEKAQIYDLNGKILRSTTISNNELNVQELQNGTYMVRLFAGQKIYVAKVVKMK